MISTGDPRLLYDTREEHISECTLRLHYCVAC